MTSVLQSLRLVLLILLSTMILPGANLKALSELEGSRLRYQEFVGVISSDEFDEMAIRLLGAQKVRLGKIAVYSSEAERALAGPLGYDHCGYESWRSMAESRNGIKSACPEVREAVKIGAGVLIRSVDHDCNRERHLLLGTANPLELRVGEERVEVLDVSFSGKPTGGQVGVQLYVRTKVPISELLARSILIQVRAVSEVRDLTVVLRTDKWFLADCSFPVFFAFEDRELPTKAAYSRTKYAACSASGSWPIRCFESRSRP